MTMSHLQGALESPNDHETDVWIEQQIWGHRLYNDQTPWLLLLEALGIMQFRNSDANHSLIFPGLIDGRHENFTYSLAMREELRTILFKDRHIEEIASSGASDAHMWNEWFARVMPGGEGANKLGYLRKRFTHFTAFANAVALLRAAEIESNRTRRATSRHLAPRGPNMLTADYGEGRKGTPNKDRRFFSRGGELLYMMLNRSARRETLESLVADRLLADRNKWDTLARVFQPKEENKSVSFDSLGYLPMPSHPAYDRIAEDWVSLLSLHKLPDDSLLDPLMRLTGLGIIRYMIERATEVLGIDDEMTLAMPIDMVSTTTVGVKKISKDCFRQHRDITRMVIERVVDDVEGTAEWATAKTAVNPVQAINDLVNRKFHFKTDDPVKPAAFPELIKKEAISNHDQHLGRVIGFYAEQIGLAVARKGVGRWYAASDGIIEALVYANVNEPWEFEAFLTKLWDRYGIIIGPHVAGKAFKTFNYGHFKANERLFEERLRVLGLLNRLSDDCAFVKNPFHGGKTT
ncbi:hypothetical protein [Roseibium suaedae]|uniref:Uncharacterized protein n=1 Tax=Roseibium suaedae TaxID=735517 RepID=A0A1M7L5Y8_9HYPH|nr:hypothetical protein [Roseibium suaedae]SHM73316.1 hypothetical protein SAMN05444272_3083 [Roseibium suaedae]